MAVSQPFSVRECRFSAIHRIDITKLPVKFYNNNFNGSIFEFFSEPKIGHISETIIDRDER